MSHAPLVLSAVVLLVNVAYSAHALREWRREARPGRAGVPARRTPAPAAAARPLDLAAVGVGN